MSERSMMIGERSRNVLDLAVEAYRNTIKDRGRKRQLEDLGLLVDEMVKLIYGYTCIDDDSLNTDDEIINWTMPDVWDDLNSAILAIASGCYKTAASSMRNALDIGFCSLYFQVRQNESGLAEDNEFFKAWDRGFTDTPNRRTTSPVVAKLVTIQRFDLKYECSVLKEANDHFHYLCCFTHGRPFNAADGLPSNAMNLNGAVSPNFDAELFRRFESLFRETISWICIPWVVGYPKLVETRPLGLVKEAYSRLLQGERGRQALEISWE